MLGSDVKLPISVQGSLLDFTFAQEMSQCGGNSIWFFSEFFGQIALANDHIPGRVALMDFVTVCRNPIGESAKFLFLLMLCTLGTGLIGLQTPSAYSCNSGSTGNQHDPPVQC